MQKSHTQKLTVRERAVRRLLSRKSDVFIINFNINIEEEWKKNIKKKYTKLYEFILDKQNWSETLTRTQTWQAFVFDPNGCTSQVNVDWVLVKFL